MSESKRERERACVCACVCLCEREREKKRLKYIIYRRTPSKFKDFLTSLSLNSLALSGGLPLYVEQMIRTFLFDLGALVVRSETRTSRGLM